MLFLENKQTKKKTKTLIWLLLVCIHPPPPTVLRHSPPPVCRESFHGALVALILSDAALCCILACVVVGTASAESVIGDCERVNSEQGHCDPSRLCFHCQGVKIANLGLWLSGCWRSEVSVQKFPLIKVN